MYLYFNAKHKYIFEHSNYQTNHFDDTDENNYRIYRPDEVIKNSFILSLLQMNCNIYCYKQGQINNLPYYFPTRTALILATSSPKISHEISHLVEREDISKIVEDDFGFIPTITRKKLLDWHADNLSWENHDKRYNKFGLHNNSFFESHALTQNEKSEIFHDLTCEIKVRAIQSHMDFHSNQINIFDNDYWKFCAHALIPFNQFNNIQDLLEWAEELKEITYKSWNLDRIKNEWIYRVSYIQGWMETE